MGGASARGGSSTGGVATGGSTSIVGATASGSNLSLARAMAGLTSATAASTSWVLTSRRVTLEEQTRLLANGDVARADDGQRREADEPEDEEAAAVPLRLERVVVFSRVLARRGPAAGLRRR